MMIVNEKIGMYTEDEILEHLTEGEGRGFLGRSMYDAIFDKIHALKTEKEQLKQENARFKDKIEKATNFVDKYMDEWDFQDEVWKDMNDLLILLKEN